MITGILFYEKELEDDLKIFLWRGMKTFKRKHNREVTTIALNKEQFGIEAFKPILALFEKKGIVVLFLDDINKNHYQVGCSDEFLNRVVYPEGEKELSVY